MQLRALGHYMHLAYFRLEERVSNLESKNQTLRQQALTLSPTGKAITTRSRTSLISKTHDNGNNLHGDVKCANDVAVFDNIPKEPESEEKPQKSLNEKQQEDQDLLIKCISQDLGFSRGKPVAASVIYKSLLHWRSFEVERTGVFDRIIQTIASATAAPDSNNNNNVLAYWLSNTSTLFMMLQQTLKASGEQTFKAIRAARFTPQCRTSQTDTVFGRMALEWRSSQQSPGLSSQKVEAKYPALLFKEQIAAFLEKIYVLIRDNLKKEISPVLELCIQAPRISRASLFKGRSQANAVDQQASHWQSIVKHLTNYLKIMQGNCVPPVFVLKIFSQTFSFINVQLFNSLLFRRECCSFSHGEYMKSGLAELEQWCSYASDEYVGSAWDELKHIRQAVGFLVVHQKSEKTFDEITNQLCPVLSIQQLYRISSTMYWDEKYGTKSVSSEFISDLRVMMTYDSENSWNFSFILDDDSSFPFSVDDISKSIQQQIDVEKPPPRLLREASGFQFLHQPSTAS